MVDETLNCIRAGMLSLLQEKDYSNIQMKEIAERSNIGRRTLYRYFENKELILKYIAESLMDRLADEIAHSEQMTLFSVTCAFFQFLQNNRTEFMLLKKARLLSYIEDHLFELISRVAAKTKYKEMDPEEMHRVLNSASYEDQYDLQFTIAGVWRIGMLWLEESHDLTPEQMTIIIGNIMRRK